MNKVQIQKIIAIIGFSPKPKADWMVRKEDSI